MATTEPEFRPVQMIYIDGCKNGRNYILCFQSSDMLCAPPFDLLRAFPMKKKRKPISRLQYYANHLANRCDRFRLKYLLNDAIPTCWRPLQELSKHLLPEFEVTSGPQA